MNLRPRLVSFRVEAFSSDNRSEGEAAAWDIKLDNTIQIGVAVPTAPGQAIQGVVKLNLIAQARNTQTPDLTAAFRGDYAARFVYPDGATEDAVSALVATEEHQYLLAAQAFPLAMSHFRRELLATGFEASNLPLGL
jgi:hypothetical protein